MRIHFAMHVASRKGVTRILPNPVPLLGDIIYFIVDLYQEPD
jgi:hypothetical protein